MKSYHQLYAQVIVTTQMQRTLTEIALRSCVVPMVIAQAPRR